MGSVTSLCFLKTVEEPENIPFPDGKEISPTDRDWTYSITGELYKQTDYTNYTEALS